MADLLVINKVDLAPYVGADVDRMLADAGERRDGAAGAADVAGDAGGRRADRRLGPRARAVRWHAARVS